MPLHPNQIYEFGPFQVSVAERVVRRHGEIVPLTPKCFDTLLVLVQNAGSVVEKGKLIEAVWPNTFVEEGNLSQNVFNLRKALGETPTGGQYIQTIPKRGYRLDCTAEIVSTGAQKVPVSQAALFQPDSRRLDFRFVPLAVAGVLVAAATLIAARLLWPPSERQVSQVRLTPIAVANPVAYGIVSPDGKHIAYVADQEMVGQSLWVRETDGVGPGVRLANPLPGHFWGVNYSPNGDSLYYTFEDDLHPVGGTLFRISASGGEAERLMTGGGVPVFSPDGSRVVFSRRDISGRAQLITATSRLSETKVIATSDAAYPFNNVQWAADGKSIYYVEGVRNFRGSAWSTFELPATGGPAKLVTGPLPNPMRSVYWLTRSDILALIPDDDSGVSQIWHLREGSPALRLTSDTADYTMFSLTADARTLLANKQETQDSIWTVPTQGVSRREPVEMSLPAGSYNTPVWTPDGRVVYVGDSNLWLASSDGLERKPLIPERVFASEPAVSTDGRSIVFVLKRRGSVNLWRTGIDGGGIRQVTTGRLDWHPALSPDGKWVAYASEVNGHWGIWKAPLDRLGPPVKLVDSGWESPIISPDAKLIAFPDCAVANPRIQVRSFDDGSPAGEVTPPPDFSNLRWSRDGKALTFLSHADRSAQLWSQPIAGGAPARIGEPLPNDVRQLDWSADRSHIVYLRREIKVELVLMTNFR